LSFVQAFVADPRDRFLAPIDPLLRNARRRFTTIVIIACVLHGVLLLFLLLRDHSNQPAPETEVPIEVVVMPQQPPPPPPPKPEAQKKEPPKPQAKEKEHFVKPATDAPPPPNEEKQQRESTADQTSAPAQAKPTPTPVTEPTPDKPVASNAAPEAAERTAAPDTPEDKPDAEVVSKAAPLKDQKPTDKQKEAKTKAPLPAHDREALAKQFAALSQTPQFSIASAAKPSPVTGGHCTSSPYLCTLFGLIMRKQHYPESARAQHIEGTVVVAFWVDERGDLTHQALYKTSGHPVLDAEAMDTIHRAAPFPPPPPDSPHGFIAQMEFPPK
jgi:protein TonB